MSKSYAEITEKLRDHFEPEPVIIAERFEFHKRNQLTTENVAAYLAELRRLAARCEFGASLDEVLRDRLVCGLMDESVQKSLLSVRALTLAAAVEKAKSVEAVKRDAQAMRCDPLPVSKLEESGRFASPGPSGPGGERRACYRCGNASHTG